MAAPDWHGHEAGCCGAWCPSITGHMTLHYPTLACCTLLLALQLAADLDDACWGKTQGAGAAPAATGSGAPSGSAAAAAAGGGSGGSSSRVTQPSPGDAAGYTSSREGMAGSGSDGRRSSSSVSGGGGDVVMVICLNVGCGRLGIAGWVFSKGFTRPVGR
jgi:hypothetical protein